MKMPRPHALASLLAALALPACDTERSGPGPDQFQGQNSGVTIATDRGEYAQGAVVTLAISNHESVPLAYNSCTRDLEVKDGANWIPGPEGLRLCTKDVRYVGPGAVRDDVADLEIGLQPGEYRMVIDFNPDFGPPGSGIKGYTNSFIVSP
jgi:hypothetical protein